MLDGLFGPFFGAGEFVFGDRLLVDDVGAGHFLSVMSLVDPKNDARCGSDTLELMNARSAVASGMHMAMSAGSTSALCAR